jgi:hypothetical protein
LASHLAQFPDAAWRLPQTPSAVRAIWVSVDSGTLSTAKETDIYGSRKFVSTTRVSGDRAGSANVRKVAP